MTNHPRTFPDLGQGRRGAPPAVRAPQASVDVKPEVTRSEAVGPETVDREHLRDIERHGSPTVRKAARQLLRGRIVGASPLSDYATSDGGDAA